MPPWTLRRLEYLLRADPRHVVAAEADPTLKLRLPDGQDRYGTSQAVAAQPSPAPVVTAERHREADLPAALHAPVIPQELHNDFRDRSIWPASKL